MSVVDVMFPSPKGFHCHGGKYKGQGWTIQRT